MKKLLLCCAFIFCTYISNAQSLAVNGTGAAADASAILDVQSTSKGLLAPRMTAAQKGLIASPATGLTIYQTDGSTGFYTYNGTGWIALLNGGSTLDASKLTTGTVSTARLGSGTASATTYLRGDGSWATPAVGGTSFKTVFKSVVYNATTSGTYTSFGGPAGSAITTLTVPNSGRLVFDAPYNGKLLKIKASIAPGGSIPGNVTISMYKNDVSIETKTVNVSSASTSYGVDFTTNTFNENDRITFFVVPTTAITATDLSLTYVVEFTP
jgi:hypothetical protein